MHQRKTDQLLLTRAHEALVYLAGAALVFFNYKGHWSAHWFSKFSLLMAMASLIFSWVIARRTSWLFLPGLLTATLSGVWVAAWAFNGYPAQFDVAFVEGLGRDGWYGYISLCFAALLVAFFPTRLTDAVERTLAGICVVSVLWTIGTDQPIAYYRVAFSGNASMNGTLIAVLFPFLWERIRHRGWAVVPVALSIFLTGASIPLGVFAVVLATLFLTRMKWSWKGAGAAAGVVVTTLGLGWLSMGEVLFKDSSRFDNWKQFMEWWGANANPWFGAGLGTSLHLLSYLNLKAGQSDNVYLWMHNDWLQTLFELGWVGLLSMLLAAAVIAWRSLDRPHLAAAFLGYCAAGIFNYPLRLPVHALGLTLTVALIMSTPRSSSSKRAPRLDL